MNTITLSTIDDIVFEHRNRAYGAYVLRQLYQPTLTRAAIIGVGLFLVAVSAPTLYAHLVDRNAKQEIMVETNLEKLTLEPLPEKVIEIPPVEKLPAVSTVRSLPPEVLPDEEVEAPREEALFITVEQQPEYPGGMAALGAFIQKNLKYPQQAIRSDMSGRVFVSFVVNTNGSLTDVQVLKGIGFGCDEEALRVIRQMPRWKPGMQSGRAVRVRYNLPVAFTLE